MTREEITELLYDKCSLRNSKDIVLLCDNIETIADFIAIRFENLNKNLADLDKENKWLSQLTMNYKQHETDLLKKFVEWYKGHLEHIQEHENELLDDDRKRYPHLVEYRNGTIDMLDRLLSHIDGKVEEFLEEKEKMSIEQIERDLEVLNVLKQKIIDEKKCVGDVRPADIPYDEHMKALRENDELKETIIKLVKKLNECMFFD